MRKSEVSSKDIADACGVSRTTVSFVLNNTPGKIIPSETRERIIETARKLGYIPDPEARRVAKRTRARIGLVVNHSDSIYSDAYILRLIEGMAPVFNKKRCRLVLLPLRQREADYGAIVEAHGLDGLMITNARADDAAMRALIDLGLPCVVIGTVEGLDAPQIDIDNEAAAFAVTDHLLALGHRRVAMVVHAPLSYIGARDRLAGYRKALEARGLSYDEALVRVADFTEASGYAAARSVLAERPSPEALFTGNDAIAYGAMQAILDEGLGIPDDISIAGFDDDFPSRFLEPALTTMTLPAAALGEGAATKVIALLDGLEVERRTILPTRLSVRDSCRPAGKA